MYKTELLPYWRKAEEVPEPESTVLAFYIDDWGDHYVVATWTSENEWWFPGSDKKDYEVVAWQSLPTRPARTRRSVS